MEITLKGKIQNIVKTLKKAKKIRLAESIEKNWNKTALQYSKELNFWRPKMPIEKEMLEAFGKELDRLDSGAHKTDILKSLNKRRILQTSPHLVATESPRMFCINWLSSLGVKKDEYYVVGMYSGIPFSNSYRPGRINNKNNTVNLFPSNMQDGMVYRSVIPEKLIKSVDELPVDIARFLPRAKVGESYTKWALTACQHIERKIFKKNNLVYLDINEIVSEYLVKVLDKDDHPLHKMFFDPMSRKEFTRIFRGETLFYTPTKNGKYAKMENMSIVKNVLKSKTQEIPLKDKKELINALKNNRLCPALITTFIALAFLNQFKCFGSFGQVEYLPVYQKKLAKLKFLKPYKIEQVPTANLTTGTFPEKSNLYPIDIIALGKFAPKENILFGNLLLPMKKALLESYFTGNIRTNGKK